MRRGCALLILSAMLITPIIGAEKEPIVFMKNSGWCWYEDPRAIIHKDKLVIGGVEGNGDGAAVVGVYDLKKQQILGRTVVNPKFNRDDHNSPVFYARPDGSLLTVYARHHADKLHLYRISDPNDYLMWSDEYLFRHDYESAGNVSYMNLYYLSEEETLYNFFRGIRYNPSFITSSDHGRIWGNPTHLIANEGKGSQRPYARYTSNNRDTIHISFTDAHPRDFGTSIYYAAFRGGNFHSADGSLIKNLKQDGPLRPSEAEKIFQGGGRSGRGVNLSAPLSAWTASIALDGTGRPHLGYTLYLSNTDHRFRMAVFDGNRWIDREVAYAGKCLYDQESSYTGLIAMDPLDPTRVVISSDVDPATGQSKGGTHEIYHARVTPGDDIKTIIWEPLTRQSPEGVRNIRPLILNTDNCRITLWQRGRFNTYMDYNLDTVGLLERKEGEGTK